ncbi:MAG: ribbon-helix-helix domain-containing protein [Candidatus Bathyarchaeia archaeon]
MKTLRISDETHRRLTATLGMLMAETGELQTYDSTITALLMRSVKLPKETIMEVENFIKENRHRGYITKEEFIKEAIRFKLNTLKSKKEYIEIPKEKCEKLNQALKVMNTPYSHLNGYVHRQIKELLKQL